MTNFEAILPEVEQALAAAVRRHQSERPAPARRGLLRRRPARLAALALAGALVAGSAIAATKGWDPLVGDLATDGPPELVHSPVPARIADALGVLRRPQDARDRGPEVRATLRTVSGYHVEGLRPGSVRYLAPSVGGQAAVLVSVEEAEGSGSDPLCLIQPTAPRGSVPDCFHLPTLRAGNAIFHLGGPNGGAVSGIVPDEVTAVIIHFADGAPKRLPVANNYFHLAYKRANPINEGVTLEEASGKVYRPHR